MSDRSDVEGHFENFSEQEFEPFWYQQVLPAEYEPTGAVIVTGELVFSNNKTMLLQEIIRAGAEVWLVTTDSEIDVSLLEKGITESEIKNIKKISAPVRTIWTRDYAPLVAIPKDNTENGLRLIDINYYDQRPNDDLLPQEISESFKISRISIPVYNEGGNIMCAKELCAMTVRVSEANSDGQVRDSKDVLSDAQIIDYYSKATSKKIIIMPRLPFEGTGHIDMWAKFFSDKDVVINEVWDETLNVAKGEGHKKILLELKQFLDKRAQEFSSMGFQVTRIPMPIPALEREDIMSERKYEEFRSQGSSIFRSYTNGLVINGTYIIPRYTKLHYYSFLTNDYAKTSYMDDALIAKYERAVTERLNSIGIKNIAWIDSDDTIAIGGAVHCTTMQIPKVAQINRE